MTTEFLLGGGLAFLIALLGWSDQIRGVQEKSRAQEREFLATYDKIRWQDLRGVVRPSEEQSPKERLLAVLRLLKQGALANEVDVKLLKQFEDVDATRNSLEAAYSYRYWTIIVASGSMFLFGALTPFLKGAVSDMSTLTWNECFSALCFVQLVLILGMTAYTAVKENTFRRGLNSIEDVLRTTRDRVARPER